MFLIGYLSKQMQPEDCLRIAEETLEAMNRFAERLPTFLRFPPSEDDAKMTPSASYSRDRTVDASQAVAASLPTEKDEKKTVEQCPLRFSHIKSKMERTVPLSQVAWELGADSKKHETAIPQKVCDDWYAFRERAELWTIKQTPRSGRGDDGGERNRETPEDARKRDEEIVEEIQTKYKEKYTKRVYELVRDVPDPLFDIRQKELV